MNPYIGHDSQLYRMEEHRLSGGRGDGMRLLEISNGKGLELTVSLDRCADISRLSFRGINMSYFSPCGYVAPDYYDDKDNGWLKSFTAGYLTTCGLRTVGTPSDDGKTHYPLHGTIANTPAEQCRWYEEYTEEGKVLTVCALIKDENIFGAKLRLYRELRISTVSNMFTINDTIENTGDTEEGIEILYHMNMGYPLLDEDSVVDIPSVEVTPRDQHAADDIANWKKMTRPERGCREKCYYHRFAGREGRAAIWQPKLSQGLEISFDASELDGFVEWKMMGVRDYVLGLECGNCLPDGRNVMKESGRLKYIAPGEKKTYQVKVRMLGPDERPGREEKTVFQEDDGRCW